MPQTEAEMWAGLAKSEEAGQLVYSGPAQDQRETIAREMYDRGWDDLGFLGVGSGFYQGSATGLALLIQCADVKARDISKAEMLQWRRNGRGWQMVEPVKGELAYHLMTKPNHTAMTWPEFWRMVVLHHEVAQNAYIYTPRDREDTIEEYITIMPGRARMRVSDRGNIFYEIVAATEYDRAVLGDTYLIVPEHEMIHLRGRLLDGVNGLSNVVLGSPNLDLLSAIGRFQTKLFGNDGKQPLVFETKEGFPNSDMGEAAFRRLKDQLREAARRASGTGEAILLEAGLTAKAIAINAVDAQSKDSFTQAVMRICGLMDVPPHRIYALESVAYNNMASMNRQYVNDCLMPLAFNFETKFRNHSLPQDDWPRYSLQFDRSALMSNDPDTIEKLVKTGMSTGIMEIDEAREIMPFRLNPLGQGGQVRTVPVTMALVDRAGNVIQAATGQNATQPGAGEDESPDNNAGKAGPRLVHSAGAA
ncbi:phage portal protein [Methylobacterium sp. ARG-1]|uniref:phage portal protein n=1 Tax=Methylobacterium sp. ARG-1 TaxID=1692501 RepID=UPI0006801148|nr:phage portal protein [Methylobacterium sp. ARG-1]KNY21661.1 phage portal protein [Methylobacterium sp. ARG-1]